MGLCREKMYKSIEKNGLNHEETIIASKELDKDVLNEMLKDPKVENLYLKQVIKAKDYQIRDMQRRIMELTEIAQMKYEAGASALNSVKLVVNIANKEIKA